MGDLYEAPAEFIPLIEGEEPWSFEEFVNSTVTEVELAASAVEEPEGDVLPFLTMAAGGSFGKAIWRTLDPALDDKFLTHVVPPTIAGGKATMGIEMVAVVLTMFLTPMTDETTVKRGSDRYEAIMIAALSNRAEEVAVEAPIERSPDGPPGLGEFKVVTDK